MTAAGGLADERRQRRGKRRADRRRDHPIVLGQVRPLVARVPEKQLVATVARQSDRDVLASLFRQKVDEERGRIAERLVEVPHHLRQEIDQIGLDRYLGVYRAEPVGDNPGEFPLIVQAFTLAERHAEGAHRGARVARH
jgi:hypothetical protein